MADRIAPARLREVLDYDPSAGTLTWRLRPRSDFSSDQSHRAWNTKYAGKPALNCRVGGDYPSGTIDGRSHRAHRVAWAVYNGSWPIGEIDHINGDRADYRIVNLREVSRVENSRNLTQQRRNKTGATGVRKDGRQWMARITVDYRRIEIGRFSSFDEALAARKAAEREHGFHRNHGRIRRHEAAEIVLRSRKSNQGTAS